MNSIFDYTDHLQCLNDIYQHARKSRGNAVSYATISTKLGYSSRGIWGHFLKGKIPLKADHIKILSEFFCLHEQEAKYLDLIVKYNQASDKTERYKYKKLLSSFKKVNRKFIEDDQHNFYSDWLNTVIRNLCTCDDFKKQDYAKMNSHLIKYKLPNERIKSSIKYLLSNNYIKEDEDGYLRAADRHVLNRTMREIDALNDFHLQMINFGKNAVQGMDKKQRQISSMNVSVSSEGYNHIIAMLQECRSKIWSIVEDEKDCEKVYQLNFQIFPMTSPPQE